MKLKKQEFFVRIIGGEYKGQIVYPPKGVEIRATQAKVREAFLNIIRERVQDAVCMDGFCGSGAIGVELLSWGAAKVVFLDREKECIEAVKRSIDKIGTHCEERAIVLQQDLFRFIRDNRSKKYNILFDIIFLDPPYYLDIAKKCLKKIIQANIIHQFGLLVIEHHKKDQIPETEDKWCRVDCRTYGDTCLSFYQKRQGFDEASSLSRDI